MSQRSNIRWSDKDNRRIDNLVKRYNRKLGKLANDPNVSDLLPEKVTRGQIKKEIMTRSELNQKLNSLNRFMKKDATQVVTTKGGYQLTKYDVREYKEKVRILNIQKAYKRKALDLSPDKGVSSQRSNLGLLPKKNTLPKSRKEYDKGIETLTRQLSVKDKLTKLEQYRENYLSGLKQLPNYEGKIKPLIENLSDIEIFNLTVANPKLIIDFYYDEDQSEDTRGTEILSELEITLNSG